MRVILSFTALLMLSGCVQMPVGPSVPVMPGPAKPFELFASEENMCRGYAETQTGISPQTQADRSMAAGVIGGTALGAAAGTAIGALAGDIGAGAVAGAGFGLLSGTAMGIDTAYGNGSAVQRRYDIAFEQCMYAKGNQVPGFPVIAAPPPPPPPNLGRPRVSK